MTPAQFIAKWSPVTLSECAVLAAYGATDPAGQWSEDWATLWQPTGAGQPLPETHPLAARRQEIDQKVLENLLRMNLARAGEE